MWKVDHPTNASSTVSVLTTIYSGFTPDYSYQTPYYATADGSAATGSNDVQYGRTHLGQLNSTPYASSSINAAPYGHASLNSAPYSGSSYPMANADFLLPHDGYGPSQQQQPVINNTNNPSLYRSNDEYGNIAHNPTYRGTITPSYQTSAMPTHGFTPFAPHFNNSYPYVSSTTQNIRAPHRQHYVYGSNYRQRAPDSNAASSLAVLNNPQQLATMNAVRVAVATATAAAVAIDHSQFQQCGQTATYCPSVQLPQTVNVMQPNSITPTYGLPSSSQFSNHRLDTISPAYCSTSIPALRSLGNATRGAGNSARGRRQAAAAQRLIAAAQSPLYNNNNNNNNNNNVNNNNLLPDSSSPSLYQQQSPYAPAGAHFQSVCNNPNNNPTPPMTPIDNLNYLPTLNADQKSERPVKDVKPVVNCQMASTDTLTMYLQDGIILPAFRLQHNSPVSRHFFGLTDDVMNLLRCSSEYDLQLKCFHQESKSMTMTCNWPKEANVQICINNTPVCLFNHSEPLFFKQLVQQGKNVLQISVQRCSCSHLFELALVRRVSFASICTNLLKKKVLTFDQACQKIRRLFLNDNNESSTGLQDGNGADIEQTSINMSLCCPISRQRIRVPSRGINCRHIQCFDVETFLRLNKDCIKWTCPLCRLELNLESLEIDEYFCKILNRFKDSKTDEVIIDSSLVPKPYYRGQSSNNDESIIKIKDIDEIAAVNVKRFKYDTDLPAGSNDGQLQYQSWSQPSPFTPPSTASAGSSVMSPHHLGIVGSPVQLSTTTTSLSQRSRNGNKPATPRGLANSQLNDSSSLSPYGPPSVGPQPHQQPTPASSVVVPSRHNVVHSGREFLTSCGGSSGGSRADQLSVSSINHQQSIGSVGLQNQSSNDGYLISGSAPYTPASVSSIGSLTTQNSIGSVHPPSSDAALQQSLINGGHGDPLFDLESLFTTNDSATSNGPSSALFADSIDPQELSKYLGNDCNPVHNSTSSPIGPLVQSNNDCLSVKNGQSQFGGDDRFAKNSNVNQSSNDLELLEDVLSFLR